MQQAWEAFAKACPEDASQDGSHRSRMIDKLRKGHNKVKLSREELIRLVTWIDTNANYYGTYEGKKNIKWKADPDFRPAPDQMAHTPR